METEDEQSLEDALMESFEGVDEDEPEGESTDESADTEQYVEEDAAEAEATEDSEDAEPETVFQAPEHWSSDEKEAFASLPPEAQDLVLQRDKAFQQGFQEKAQSITDIQQAIEPWTESLAQRGMSPANAIRTLFAAQAMLDRDPLNGILQLAETYRVSDRLREQFAPTDDDDLTDPEVKALRAENRELRQRFDQFEKGIESQRTSTVEQQIQQFREAKAADGAPKYPHFDKVRHLMGPLVGQGKSMEQAYEETVWTVPEYRESLQKPKDELEQRRKVSKAKKAARGVKPKGQAKETDDDLSLDDALLTAWNQHS